MVDAAGVVESACVVMFNLNIFHMLVFSHSFIVDVEAPPELRKRRHGCQKMRLVLRHNESWTSPTRDAHSEQRSRFLPNVREKSAADFRRTMRLPGGGSIVFRVASVTW